jgi:hypothetical protein
MLFKGVHAMKYSNLFKNGEFTEGTASEELTS